MNYITEAIEYLTHYKNFEIASDNLDLIIKEFESELEKCKNDVPGDRIYNLIFQRDKYKELYGENKSKLSTLEKMISKLEDEYRKIITLSYIEKRNETEILDELNISRATYYRVRTKAIKTFAIQLFGIAAM